MALGSNPLIVDLQTSMRAKALEEEQLSIADILSTGISVRPLVFRSASACMWVVSGPSWPSQSAINETKGTEFGGGRGTGKKPPPRSRAGA